MQYSEKYVDEEWLIQFLLDSRCKLRKSFIAWIFQKVNNDLQAKPKYKEKENLNTDL